MPAISWENTLVLQTSFLGDMVLTLPLIAEIRRRFPVTRLTLLCQAQSRELLQDHPAIDEILVDDKKKSDRGLAGLHAQARALKAKRFTVALTPHKSLRSALLLCLADIPWRIGFRQSKGWMLFHQRADRDPGRHDVERNLGILQALGVRPEDCARTLDLPTNVEVENAVRQKLRRLGVSDDHPVIGINPGSVWPTKRWSPAGFGELIRMLKKFISCQVLLFGGPEDSGVVDQVQQHCAGAAIDLAGEIGLRELPAAISRCAVFVTNDSGPMHVAVARRVPTLAIFCATTPELGFAPYSADAIVVQRDLSCRPCASHGGRRCPLGHAGCIHQIRAEKVFEAVRELLSKQRQGSRGARPPFQPEVMTV